MFLDDGNRNNICPICGYNIESSSTFPSIGCGRCGYTIMHGDLSKLQLNEINQEAKNKWSGFLEKFIKIKPGVRVNFYSLDEVFTGTVTWINNEFKGGLQSVNIDIDQKDCVCNVFRLEDIEILENQKFNFILKIEEEVNDGEKYLYLKVPYYSEEFNIKVENFNCTTFNCLKYWFKPISEESIKKICCEIFATKEHTVEVIYEGGLKKMQKSNIKIYGHTGTWYVIDESVYKNEPVFLLEHEEYGDEAACLIVKEDLTMLLEDVWNGFDDLELLEMEE